MIELLILYILNSRDRTVYALRREIIERFGAITTPSLGTIYPALKRLHAKDAVKFDQKFSEGGKKSTYYSIGASGKKVFKELFFQDISSNPTIFHSHLCARLLTISMLDNSDRLTFLNELSRKIEIHKTDVEKTLQNPYTDHNEWQKAVIEETLNGANSLYTMVEKLKNF